MKYTVVPAFIAVFAFLVSASPVLAAQTPNCTPIFGGSNSCLQTDPIQINKQVQNPSTQQYVDSLSTNDATFAPGQTIRFKITIANTGNTALKTMTVRDSFPTSIDFSKGEGNYDKSTRTLSFTIDELGGKQNKVFFVEGKATLPTNQQNACVINQVEATADNKTSRDNTRVCLTQNGNASTSPTTKGGTTIYPPTQSKTTPETGPETLAVIGLLPAGLLGFWLKKRGKL